MNTSPLIDIQQITYIYPLQMKSNSAAQSHKALQDVSLQIQPGEYLAILGHRSDDSELGLRLYHLLHTQNSVPQSFLSYQIQIS